jgi:hypothetical protein
MSRIPNTGFLQCCGPDPYIFRPGSITILHGSVSLHHQAKRVRKTLIQTVLTSLRLFVIEELCKYIFKKQEAKKYFFVGIFEVTDENKPDLIRKSVVRIRESGSILKCHGSTALVFRL